ncbi:MAG: TraR/DksA C4-type zinc finger protein [Pseudomonadota bacterium]
MNTAHLIERIKAEIAELQTADAATAQDRKAVELDQQSVGRLSRMDALQVQAMAQAESRRRSQRIQALKAALKRAAEDELGYCQDCGEPIAEARLDLDPAATRCIDCARGMG